VDQVREKSGLVSKSPDLVRSLWLGSGENLRLVSDVKDGGRNLDSRVGDEVLRRAHDTLPLTSILSWVSMG